MAKLIRDDGRCEIVKPARGKFTLAEVQTLIGGDFQVLATTKNQVMLVDEEAKLKRKKINNVASHLYKYGAQDPIRGDVLIVSRKEFA